MLSTFLANHSAVAPVLLWVAVACCGALGWFLIRSGRERVLLVLAAVSGFAALTLTFTPSDGQRYAFCTVEFSVPGHGIEVLANAALLLPLTLFAALGLKQPAPVFAAASGLSALIELVQALVPVLGRSCDTDDWFMNTLGAAVGALLAAGIRASTKRYSGNGRRRDSANAEAAGQQER